MLNVRNVRQSPVRPLDFTAEYVCKCTCLRPGGKRRRRQHSIAHEFRKCNAMQWWVLTSVIFPKTLDFGSLRDRGLGTVPGGGQRAR